jgi:hypothetical protein
MKILFKSVEMLLLSFGPGHFIRKRQTFFFSLLSFWSKFQLNSYHPHFKREKIFFSSSLFSDWNVAILEEKAVTWQSLLKDIRAQLTVRKRIKYKKKFSSYWEKKKKTSRRSMRVILFFSYFYFLCARDDDRLWWLHCDMFSLSCIVRLDFPVTLHNIRTHRREMVIDRESSSHV